ncbi:MAG: hypothetical protein ACREB8_15530 [Pseudolabrys sp.]
MTVRRALFRLLRTLCIAAVTGLPASAATPADDGTLVDAGRGTISLDRVPASGAAERAQIGNPLWAIPLATLSVTRERPLFTPSRRPPAPAVVAVPPPVQPKPVLRPVAQEHLNLTLIGTVVGNNEGIGVFLDQATHNFVRLKTGQAHAGWTLRSVKAREATLEKDHRTETLSFPVPQSSRVPAPAHARPL